MKSTLYALTVLFSLAFSIMLHAQERYFDQMFGVDRMADVAYGQNISVLTGVPDTIPLLMDVYLPANDNDTERPVILVAHTGSFLPPLFNGQITGSRIDSNIVETCIRLASRGYVVAAYTYRQGWLPEAPDQNVRTGTLLQAAYRGIQDTRTCIRYMRKMAAEAGNPYGIDPGKIGVLGVGTGGYLALGAASLDRYEEVALDKFLDSETLLPLADTALLGNFWASTNAPLCLGNHPGYSSDVSVSVNLGGALGDTSWLVSLEGDPAFIGFHVLKDPFAPFYEGAVIVPTTLEFVVNVPGSRRAIEYANDHGYNDRLQGIPIEKDPIQNIVNIQKQVDVTLPGNITIKLGEDNMYAFFTPGLEASPWEWWDLNTLRAVVAGTNAALGTDFNADTIHALNLLINPGMSRAKATAYLDTVFAYTVPRLCKAFGLECGLTSGLVELDRENYQFRIMPNPATNIIRLSIRDDEQIETVALYDMTGRMVMKHVSIDDASFEFRVNHLPPGLYAIKVAVEDKGFLGDKILIQSHN